MSSPEGLKSTTLMSCDDEGIPRVVVLPRMRGTVVQLSIGASRCGVVLSPIGRGQTNTIVVFQYLLTSR
jgi:hypothetical protein